MNKPQQMKAKLAEKRVYNNKFTEYSFTLVKPHIMEFDPGQYVSILVDKTGARRSYSICSKPENKDAFDLLIDSGPQGVGVKFFDSLEFGDEIDLMGPLGRFVFKSEDFIVKDSVTDKSVGIQADENIIAETETETETETEAETETETETETEAEGVDVSSGENVSVQVDNLNQPLDELVFVATGSGVAPFRSMIMDLLQEKGETRQITLYWGLRHVETMFWENDFQDLAESFPNFKFHPVISKAIKEWPLCRGRVTDCLSTHPMPINADYYLCGSPYMIKDVTELLEKGGVKKENVHFEKFF